MVEYFDLPNEIKAIINSQLCNEVLSEFKYSSKDIFHSMKYFTVLYDDNVYVKKLFIKINFHQYEKFYYNLKSITGNLILSDCLDELKNVHRIIKDLVTPIKIIYTGNAIKHVFFLIQCFTESKCSKLTVYLKQNTHIFFTLERRDNLIVANLLPVMKYKELNNYMCYIDSLLITDDTYSSKNYTNDEGGISISHKVMSYIKDLIIRCNIRILHLGSHCRFKKIDELVRLAQTLYITSEANYTYGSNKLVYLAYNNKTLPNITKVVFEDALLSSVSNSIEFDYTQYSKLLPNATIEVYKINENDVLKGNNVIESKDNLKVRRMDKQQLKDLLNEDNTRARFPNLNYIGKIVVSMNEYPKSDELIKIAINNIDSLTVLIESEELVLPDMLKYVSLIGKTVKRSVRINTVHMNGTHGNMYYFYKTKMGLVFDSSEKLTLSTHIDTSYIQDRSDIILSIFQPFFISHDILRRTNIHKILISEKRKKSRDILRKEDTTTMDDILLHVDTLYVIGTLSSYTITKINRNIKTVFFDNKIDMKEYKNGHDNMLPCAKFKVILDMNEY